VPDPIVLQIADALIDHSLAAGFKQTGLLTDVGKDWNDETVISPAAYLGDAGERNEDSPTQSVSPRAGFFFHTIVKGNAPTRSFLLLYKALKDRIDNDPRLGGLCFRARVTGYLSDKTIPNITARVHVADVFVEVEYRHARAAA